MAPSQWLSLAACGGILILAFVVLLRRARNPLALPLGLLCIDMFIWNFGTLAYGISGIKAWHYLDTSFSPFTPPLALHLVLVFVGRVRPWRWVLLAAYLGYGFLGVSSAVGFLYPAAGELTPFQEAMRGFRAAIHDAGPSGLSPWSAAYLCGWVPMLVLEITLLVRHLKRTPDLREQMRTRLMVAALLVGGLLGSTEFWDEIVSFPALGHLGALTSMGLIAIIVLRFRLFGRELPLVVVLNAAALTVLAAFGYLAVFFWLGTNSGILVAGTTALTLVVLAACWDLVSSLVRSLTRIKTDASLGRIAAQLAHDLRNPLTPLTGGLRFLIKEREQGRSIDDQQEYLSMLLEQAQRINRVLKKYPLLPNVPPTLAPTRINAVVESVLRTLDARLSAKEIQVHRELLEELPECPADEDLIAGALENLVNNAIQAMDSRGSLTLRTTQSNNPGNDSVVITVEDDGRGMDARHQMQAFDRHFTTSEKGSGLGLDWVRRVVESHGGTIELSSVLGQGTAVRLNLPLSTDRKEEGDRDE